MGREGGESPTHPTLFCRRSPDAVHLLKQPGVPLLDSGDALAKPQHQCAVQDVVELGVCHRSPLLETTAFAPAAPKPLPPPPPLPRALAAVGESTLPTTPAAAEAHAGTDEEASEGEEEGDEEERDTCRGGYRAKRSESGDSAARMAAMTSRRPLDLSTGTPLMAMRQSPTSTRPVDSRMPLLPSEPRGKALMKICFGV